MGDEHTFGRGQHDDRAALEAENYRLRAEHADLRGRIERAEHLIDDLLRRIAAA